MKSETQIRKELDLSISDLKFWKQKFEKVDFSKDDAAARRIIIGNTINSLEGRIEALEWTLKD